MTDTSPHLDADALAETDARIARRRRLRDREDEKAAAGKAADAQRKRLLGQVSDMILLARAWGRPLRAHADEIVYETLSFDKSDPPSSLEIAEAIEDVLSIS